MSERVTVSAVVMGVLASVCPDHADASEIADDARFGIDLGMDSIEIVEVVLGCEDHFGRSAQGLLEGGPLTFGRVVDYFADG